MRYCKKCGRIMSYDDTCDFCHSKMYEVPKEYLEKNDLMCKAGKEEFLDEFVRPFPEFDVNLHNQLPQFFADRNKWIEKQAIITDSLNKGYDMRTALKHVKDAEEGRSIPSHQPNVPHCPTCGSTNVQKISGMKRWLSVGLFGLASSDVGKTMVCKKCGYKW